MPLVRSWMLGARNLKIGAREIEWGQLWSNQNESRGTEQDARCVANLRAVLGQVSHGHRPDVRAVNGRFNRRSADRSWPEGARYRWRKRRTVAHYLRGCWANRISHVHRSCRGHG